ncbi:unnamed protein product [Penicillium bialowiezense]
MFMLLSLIEKKLQHRVQSLDEDHHNRHDALTAIVLSEIIKLTVSVPLALRKSESSTKISATSSSPRPSGWVTLATGHREAAIPAVLYTIATFLQSGGAYNLDLLPYLMLSQVKLIITPIFGVMFLKQDFTRGHWVCFFMITAGIILVQSASMNTPKTSSSPSLHPPRPMLGVVYMLTSGFCVALAGVRVERMLQTPQAFMARNAHLAGYSSLFALLVYFWQSQMGSVQFFRGYTPLVWGFIVLQATGGFLVAWSVALTSTVTKNNAQVVGFLLASMIPLIMHRNANPQHLCGVMLAVGAVFRLARQAPKTNKAIGRHAAEKEDAMV